jgi:hypothetical protein
MAVTRFSGADYVPRRDDARLLRQVDHIREIVLSAGWYSVPDIARLTGYSENSVSAQLRNLRKPSHGSYRVEGARFPDGVWRYRVLPPLPPKQLDLPGLVVNREVRS